MEKIFGKIDVPSAQATFDFSESNKENELSMFSSIQIEEKSMP